MTSWVQRMQLAAKPDAVRAASHARILAEKLGADEPRQTSLAAAALQLAALVRNGFAVAWMDFEVRPDADRVLVSMRASGHGSSEGMNGPIDRLTDLLLRTGTVDRCDVEREDDGALSIACECSFVPDNRRIDHRGVAVVPTSPADDSLDLLSEEASHASTGLLAALLEARESREELSRMSQELEETNRGVVALYAELDERADELRRADQAKTRFLSNVSHELRTPLNSIRALSGLLLDRIDGPLNEEQLKQVGFIRGAADDLRQIVDDLLDLAKIAAGKTDVRTARFEIADLLGSLRGMLKPLLSGSAVQLVVDDASRLPPMVSDEAKIAQIIRNLVSNALKFTEVGEVRVSATEVDDGGTLRFEVADTGIGIAAQDCERIFEEFTQIANPLQTRAKGTGLGLPLCRRLAQLLGGSVSVLSEPGKGSTFTLLLPRIYAATHDLADEAQTAAATAPTVGSNESDKLLEPTAACVLVIDDDPAVRHTLRRRFEAYGFDVVEAGDGASGLHVVGRTKPALVLLDLQLPDMSGEDVLWRLRTEGQTQSLPVAIITSLDLDADRLAVLHEKNAAVFSKRNLGAEDFCERLLAMIPSTSGAIE